MSDYDQIGNYAMAMEKLAIVGVVAMLILGVFLLAGAGGFLWWAWHHVSVTIQ